MCEVIMRCRTPQLDMFLIRQQGTPVRASHVQMMSLPMGWWPGEWLAAVAPGAGTHGHCDRGFCEQPAFGRNKPSR